MNTRCVTVCLSTLFICAMAMAEPATKPDLVAIRDRLLAELEKKAVPEQLLLRFDEGADRDAMVLTLRRAGGRWATGYAEVPGWQQSTMQEWRGFYLGNEVAGCWRPNMRFPADLSALQLDGEQLSGTMAVAYRLDQTREQREPPGKQIQCRQ